MKRREMLEQELAKLGNMSVKEVFDRLPMGSTPQAIGHRIRKKRSLGLDTTDERNQLRFMNLLREVREMSKEQALTPERVAELKELLRDERAGVGTDAQEETN
jgi:hypothetical protein